MPDGRYDMPPATALLHVEIVGLIACVVPPTCGDGSSVVALIWRGDLVYRLPDIRTLSDQCGNL